MGWLDDMEKLMIKNLEEQSEWWWNHEHDLFMKRSREWVEEHEKNDGVLCYKPPQKKFCLSGQAFIDLGDIYAKHIDMLCEDDAEKIKAVLKYNTLNNKNMKQNIEIEIPDGKEAVLTTCENNTTFITFIDKSKEKRLYEYAKDVGYDLLKKNGVWFVIKSIGGGYSKHDELTPYQAIEVFDAIAMDLNGSWEWKLGVSYYYILLDKISRYTIDNGEYSRVAPMFKNTETALKAIEICGTEFLDIIYRRFEK